MPAIPVLSSGAAGLGVVAAKPVMEHGTAVSQFTITNYDATAVYALTASTGTASRSGATVTLSNANSTGTVTARGPKGIVVSAAGTMERKAYTWRHEQGYTCCPGWPGDCSCGNPAGCDYCSGWFSRDVSDDYRGSGYTWYPGGGLPACCSPTGEWFKAS